MLSKKEKYNMRLIVKEYLHLHPGKQNPNCKDHVLHGVCENATEICIFL